MLKIIGTIGFIQALAILVNLIRTKTVAVLLGPQGVGIVSTIDQVVQTAAHLSALSIPFAAIKFLSRSHSESHEAFQRCYASFLKALLLLAGAGTVITFGVVLFRADLLDSELMRYRQFLLLALLGIPAMVLLGFMTNVLAAAQRYKASALMAVVIAATMAAATCLGVWLGGIWGLYVGLVLGGVFLILGTLIYLRKALHLPFQDRTTSIVAELKHRPDIIPFAVMLYLATATYSLSFLVARYFVLKNSGETQAGLFQAVLAIGLSLAAVLNPANGLFLTPIMNRNIPKEEKMRAATEFQKKLIVLLNAAAMPIVLFPHLVLTILFSAKFAVAGEFVFLFVFWQWILQVAGVNQALLIGFDDLKPYTAITCLGYGCSLVSSWLLIPSYGIRGAAIGFIVSSSVIWLLTWIRLSAKHRQSLPASLVGLMGYSLAAILGAGWLTQHRSDWTIGGIALKFGIYLVFMAGLLGFFSREERTSLYGLAGKFRVEGTR
jgi:O-antigen/teichoic acid export membrane protein